MARTDPGHEEIHARWLDWLGEPQSARIWDDIIPMLASRKMWERYVEIVQANPEAQSPGNFHQWVRINYVVAQCSAIRRLLDPDSRSVSMARLLKEIAQFPEVVSRERYVALYGEDLADIGAEDWKSLAGDRDFLDPAEPEQDLAELQRTAEPVRQLVNKRIAHRNLDAFENDVTFDRMHLCIDLLAELYVKYSRLVTGGTVSTDVAMPAWDEIFRHPWIESPSDDDQF